MEIESNQLDHTKLGPHCGTCGADWDDCVMICPVCDSGLACRADTGNTPGSEIYCIGSQRRYRDEVVPERRNVFEHPQR